MLRLLSDRDHDHEMRSEHEVLGIAGLPLPVHVPLVALAVRADAALVEEDSPLREELAERVVARRLRLVVDDAVGVMRMQLGEIDELLVAPEDADALRDGDGLSV